MSVGLSGDKSTKDTKYNETQNTNTTGTYTPNNLTALQTGWNTAGKLLTDSNGQPLINAGQTATTDAVPGATALNTTAGNTAGNFANGQYNINGANPYLTPTANGSFLDQNNPNYQNMVDQFTRAAQASTDGNFAASGRYGSGANANAFNGAVANEAGGLGFQNYTNERQNQLAAASQLSANNSTGTAQQLAGAAAAPNIAASMFTPGTALATQGYAPLAAYIASITAGNGGGTQVGTENKVTNGTSNTVGTDIKASASYGAGGG